MDYTNHRYLEIPDIAEVVTEKAYTLKLRLTECEAMQLREALKYPITPNDNIYALRVSIFKALAEALS